MATDLKTLTPGAAAAASVVVGAASAAAATPSLFNTTGSGSVALSNGPTLVAPVLGTPASGNLSNCTNIPVASATGLLPVVNGGTGTASPSLVAGTNVTITGTWPNQTIDASGATGPAGANGLPSFDEVTVWTPNTGTFYSASDPRSVVTYLGGCWVCAVSHPSGGVDATFNPAKWTQIAEKGEQGIQGIQGIQGPPGGTPGGSSGNVQYNNAGAFAGMSGTTWNDTNRSLTITGGTLTASSPILELTQAWNAGAVAFSAIKLNVTDTASATASLLLDLGTGGGTYVPKFRVNKAGELGVAGAAVGGGFGLNVAGAANNSGGWRTIVNNGILIGGASSDVALSRNAAGNWLLGFTHAAAPVSQILTSQGSRVGTDSNIAGGNLTLQSGPGTGNATPSKMLLQSPVKTTSGTGAQPQTTGLAINSGAAVLSAYTFATMPSAADVGAYGLIAVTDSGQTSGQITSAGTPGSKVVAVSNGTNWYVLFLVP